MHVAQQAIYGGLSWVLVTLINASDLNNSSEDLWLQIVANSQQINKQSLIRVLRGLKIQQHRGPSWQHGRFLNMRTSNNDIQNERENEETTWLN